MKNVFIAALLLATITLAAQCPPSPKQKEQRFTLNDSVISQKMTLLSQHSTIPLQYNGTVRMYIDLYANRRNTQTNQILQRTYAYFPVIEEALERHHLPNELKYFAMVESTLNPTASAHNGRKGLWQLSPNLARQYNMTIDDYVNDCFDPELASEVACEHLTYLYAYYNDWLLAMTAFELGTATMDNVIAKADGNKDYWSLRKHLPKEVRDYIPAYTALLYIMNCPEDYGLYPACHIDTWHNTELLTVSDTLTFEQIQNNVGISVEQLSMLNPKYLKKTIPGSPEHIQTIRIPNDYANRFKATFK